MISLAYYPGWVQKTTPPAALPWDSISHIAHFGRYPLPDGTLPVADMQSEAFHAPLVAAARNAGRVPILTIGGGGSFGGQTIGANFAAACSSPAGRARLAGNVVALVEKYGYDGLDLDWEEVVPEHADSYVALLLELRRQLGTRRLLTAAVVSGLVPGRIAARAAGAVDLWNLMAYWSDGADQLAHYTAAGIPSSRCVVGAGFSDDPDFFDQTAARVRAKVAAARAGGAAGVMFWQAGDLTPTATTDPRLQPLREAMVPTTYPGASWRPLGQQTQPRLTDHQVICLHTQVGNLTGTDAYFRDQGFGGTESHFGVGGKWGADGPAGLDGKVWQWQDLDYTADANLEGNGRVISIETADNAPQSPDDIEAWTPAQLDAIVALGAWLCRTYAIPARLIPDTRPGTRGIGYHAQGTAATLPAGGERWSTTVGKPCPTARRIAQISDVIIPRVQQALDQEADDMTPAQAAQLADIAAGVNDLQAKMDRTRSITLANIQQREIDLGAQVAALAALVSGGDSALATSIGSVQAAVLGYLTAHPTDGMSDEDRAALAADISSRLAAAGMPVDSSALLDALATRLTA